MPQNNEALKSPDALEQHAALLRIRLRGLPLGIGVCAVVVLFSGVIVLFLATLASTQITTIFMFNIIFILLTMNLGSQIGEYRRLKETLALIEALQRAKSDEAAADRMI